MTDQTTAELLSNAVWVDGDPLMEAIAAAVWEHCDTSGGHSIVTDDPRNIAAVAATVARAEPAAVSAAPLPLPVSEARTRLLQALDASYCQALGHTPEGLLAAYEASRTQTADQTLLRDRIAAAIADALKPRYGGPQHNTPGGLPLTATAEEIRLHRAQPLADAVLAVLPATVDRAALVRACASFVRDTYSGEWADDAAATLETDADKIERGEPCSLLRLAAMLSATTNHDTARRAVLREAADRAEVVALRLRLKHDYGAANGAREVGAELRRMADETPAAETTRTPCSVPECDADGTGEPCTRHEREDAHAEGDHELCGPDCPEQPAAGARQDGVQRPGLRERHRAAWNALTPEEQTARLAELDAIDEEQDGPQ